MERGLFQTVDPVKSVSIYISAPMERRVLLLSKLKAVLTSEYLKKVSEGFEEERKIIVFTKEFGFG